MMDTLTTKEEILEALRKISQDTEPATTAVINNLKQAYYKLLGGTPDETEEEFKSLMSIIKEKRNAVLAEEEKQKQMNLQIKLSIIEELKELVESEENANKNYPEFKKLQQQWNEVKLLPPGKVNELWTSYQLYVEKFYDLLKLNNEFREYDFKKNLDIKTHLCESAEKLTELDDVVSAFHQLQKLHQEFRETGPVASELRDAIWERFKKASSVVNRRHQQHFEALKSSEEANLDQKTVICEIIEAFDLSELKTHAAWEEKQREVMALQAKWKTIGFAPQKMNTKIYERFRKSCDEFFQKKSAFYKNLKEEMAENLRKKTALCEKAEALKESTDWKETAEELTRLQREWKTIGPVVKKHSNTVWDRFNAACDYFFAQRGKASHSQRGEETENLKRKKAVIAQLKALSTAKGEENANQLRELTKEWNAIGHVPFKEKDKIYKEYRTIVDALYDRQHTGATQRRLEHLDRDKLNRTLEVMKAELQTYENNLGFLSTSSKKGNTLLAELNHKVEKLKADIAQTEERIRTLNENA